MLNAFPDAHILFAGLVEDDNSLDSKVTDSDLARAMSAGRLILQFKGHAEIANLLAVADQVVDFIDYGLTQKRKVLVLTQKGYSLAGGLAATFLIKRHKLNVAQATHKIRLKRAISCPSPGATQQLEWYRQNDGDAAKSRIAMQRGITSRCLPKQHITKINPYSVAFANLITSCCKEVAMLSVKICISGWMCSRLV